MQPFRTFRGVWWLPDHEDANVPGELSFTRDGGVRLALDGDLHAPGASVRFSSSPLPLVHGCGIDGTLATLTGLSAMSSTMRVFAEGPGIETTVYRVETAFLGDHLAATTTFAYARAEFTHLDMWLGGLHLMPVHHFGPTGNLDRYSVDCQWPDPIDIALPEGTVRVQGAYDVDQVGNEQVTLRTGGYVEWHLADPTDCVATVHHIISFQVLLALLTDYPVVAEHIIVKQHADTGTECRVYFQAVYETPERDPFDPQTTFISLSQLSLPLDEVLRRWRDVQKTLETPANILTSLRYSSPGVTDLQFIAMVQACEAYHAAVFSNEVLAKKEFDAKRKAIKERLDKEQWEWIASRLGNEPSLKMRLAELMADVGDVISPVCLDGIDTCTARVRDLRNGMTHPPADREAGSNGIQYIYYARLMAFTLKTQFIKALGLLDDRTIHRLKNSTASSELAYIASQAKSSQADRG